jgi:hypothetical protein
MRSFASLTLILCTASLAAIGCASSGAAHPKFGAGEWRVHLPATSSPIDELTHGSGDDKPAAHVPVDQPLPSASVIPVAPAEAGAPDKPRLKRAPRRAPVVVSAAAAVPAAEPVAAPVAAPEPAPTTVARYEAREQAAAKQQSYRAGDAIVITSALAVTAIVIITVLMILLIKNNDY